MAKNMIGKVVSTKMQKAVVISIEKKYRHPLYKKVLIKHNKMKARNEKLKLKEGDFVRIEETRPLSKDINFVVVEKITEK